MTQPPGHSIRTMRRDEIDLAIELAARGWVSSSLRPGRPTRAPGVTPCLPNESDRSD